MEKSERLQYTYIGDYMFKDKKILILGLARSGFQAAKILVKRGNEVILNDFKDESKQDLRQVEELRKIGVHLVFGSHPDDLLEVAFKLLKFQ